MKRRQVRSGLIAGMALFLGILAIVPLLMAADQPINLDENSTNGAESTVSTRVLQTYPVRIENTVHNNASGESFTFRWPGAGPGGFASAVTAGPDVGVIWTWTTVYQVYSIDSPITFTPVRTLNVFGMPPQGVQVPGGNEGLFTVPGKSIIPNAVTLSSASLTSSLITFFSPEKTVATCGADCTAGGCEVFMENRTGATVTLLNRQQDCCLEPHQLICDGECKSYLTDDQNCGGCGNECAFDEFCGNGVCEKICGEGELCGEVCVDIFSDPLNCGGCGIACGAGEYCDEGVCRIPCDQTLCGDACVDISSDPLNCGGCGNVCPDNNICTQGSCVECRPPWQTACNNQCVNIHTDPFNCGACGHVCDFSGCPSSGQGTCSQGESCVCAPTVSGGTSALQKRSRPIASVRPQRLSFAAQSKTRPTAVLTTQTLAASTVEEAPVCDLAPIAEVVPDGGRFTQSQTGGRFGKEIQTTVSIVKDGRTVAEGPCPLIVPVIGADTSGVILSPVAVATRDTTGDSLCQPGEPQCDYYVAVSDVGDSPCVNPVATLSSPPDEFNPNPVAFINAVSPYPNFPAYPGDEQPIEEKTNSVAFSISAPPDQAPDVGRVFVMTFTCANRPDPVVMPLTLGIGSACDPNHITGDVYDGVRGFLSPVNAALTQGGPVNYAAGSFNLGKTIPLKLELRCGGMNLSDAEIDPSPEVVSLTHETLGPWPLIGINGDNNANPDDPMFHCGNSGCEYQFRTNPLAPGRYVIGVKMPDSRVFQAGFTINP